MSFFGKSVGKLNNNHIMLMRFSKKNLEDWKEEKSSWDKIGKKTTRKDKIATRNRKIRENQEKKYNFQKDPSIIKLAMTGSENINEA